MFFLLRSAFWLTVAFLVIRPGVDMRASAESVASEALTRGSQFVAQQIEAIDCDSLQCHGGKAILAATLPPIPPEAQEPMQAAPQPAPIPYPRPRPDRAG